MNLTELLVTQKNVDEISNRFGLTEEQTLEAMAAVIPAFSEGLKRQTSTPESTANFIQALASGRHNRYADDPSLAMDDDGLEEGNAILGHLFENKNVSRAVAKQAAAETGIGDSMFKSLLPVMANMVMGNIFKGATASNVSSASPSNLGGGLGDLLTDALTGGGGGSGGLLGQILGELAGGMLEGVGGGTSRRRRTSAKRRRSGQPNILEDLLGELLGGGTTQRRRRTTRSRTRNAPRRRTQRNSGGGMLDGILDELLGGTGGGSTQRRTRRRSTRSTPMPPKSRRTRRRTYEPKTRDGGLGEIFGDMLEPGGNSGSRQRKQTGSIFDEFLKG